MTITNEASTKYLVDISTLHTEVTSELERAKVAPESQESNNAIVSLTVVRLFLESLISTIDTNHILKSLQTEYGKE